ncbi:MAG: tripartite tricarboxylate transporter permease [Geminicoccaceae bacterium]
MDLSLQAIAVIAAAVPFIAAGVLLGVFSGALPGFGGSNTLIILLPLTLYMEVNAALLLVVGLFVGVRFGGAIPAILINVPGTASGAATAVEGYPLYKQGHANFALGVALLASVLGTLFSGFIALAAAPIIADIALKFAASEIFALTIFSIAMVGQIAGDDLVKGWFAGAAGLLIGSVGVDPMWGIERGTLGFVELYDGIPVIPALVGLYAISEVMMIAEKASTVSAEAPRYRNLSGGERSAEILRGCAYVIRRPIDIIRSMSIGSFIGALPGAGANIASFLSYQQAVTFSRNHEDRGQFTKGNPRGIIASEAADNACASGALVPMMTLGIPGSASTAVMLVLMTLHGLSVGPSLFTENATTAYAILGALPVAACLLLVIGFASIFVTSRLVLVPINVLAPAIAVFGLAGAFAARYLLFDVFLALIFGLIGYVMRKEGFPPQAMLIGLILASSVESSFFIGLREGFGSPLIFVQRPISLGIWMMLIASTLYIAYWKRRQAAQQKAERTE